ncbi:hypothetical protein [Belnapia moabensis]|uniref:hypothetical protein n=1 Tax=Belnapia moabensis TaxID=365533 RepID=UPI0005BC3D2C|nr:hypothetical protein [Belnapia moabensis]
MCRLLPQNCAGALLAAMYFLSAAPAAAAVEEPIELADDPFQITDPVAAKPGAAEAAFIGAYERARQGSVRNTGAVETQLSMGVVPGLELRIGQVGAYGNLETRRKLGTVSDGLGPSQDGGQVAWGGATRIGALYEFSDGRGGYPAIAGLIRIRTLYGPGKPAYETEAVALIGRTFPFGQQAIGTHLNIGWVARLEPQFGERPNRYLVNASVGQALSPATALVLTYAREQQERGDRDYSLIQAGVRHRLSGGRAVLGLAAGFGTTRDTPRYQVAVALQWQLGDAW